MDSLLTWMERSRLHDFMLESLWAFPGAETIHFIGLILLFGSVAVVDLRLLGFAPRIPLQPLLAFVPLSLLGFGLNATTGILFLFSDPFRYYPNPAFRLKMLAIVFAAANAVWFKYAVSRKVACGETPGNDARVIAVLSILTWVFVIVAGRMIPYVG